MPSTKIARVRTTCRTWLSQVQQADPDYSRDKRKSIEYDFRPSGGQLFTGDPSRRGTMTRD